MQLYNKVLYQILLTHLLSLALLAEPLDYTAEYIQLRHSVEAALSHTTLLTGNSTQLSQKTAGGLSRAAALSLTRTAQH